MRCSIFWLGRFDHPPHYLIKFGFIGCGDARRFGLCDEIV
jgi:hypothetical protein